MVWVALIVVLFIVKRDNAGSKRTRGLKITTKWKKNLFPHSSVLWPNSKSVINKGFSLLTCVRKLYGQTISRGSIRGEQAWQGLTLKCAPVTVLLGLLFRSCSHVRLPPWQPSVTEWASKWEVLIGAMKYFRWMHFEDTKWFNFLQILNEVGD